MDCAANAGTRASLLNRLLARKGHFMPASLLDSQLDTFELPQYGIHLDIDTPLETCFNKSPHIHLSWHELFSSRYGRRHIAAALPILYRKNSAFLALLL
ncbi:MAG: hypothetical protein R2795_15945 [Saprospiraceae bacterium]